MPKLGIDITNNIDSNISDFKKLDKTVDKVGRSVDNTKSKIGGLGAGLKKALGAFAVGGAIQKGIGMIAEDINKAAENTLKNNMSSAQLFGQLGIEGVEAARNLATSEGFDIARTQQLINDISSGTSASGISFEEQKRLGTLAIRAEKAVGIPANVISSVGAQLINAAPNQFAKSGGAVAATNLTRAIGRAGDLPNLSDISYAGGAIAAGAAADIPVRASESASVFTFLTGSAGKEKSKAGTSAEALLRKYQVLGGNKSFTEWLDGLLPLSAAELQKYLGDQGAVGAVLAIKANPNGYKRIRNDLDNAVSNKSSIINKEYKNRLEVDKVFAAKQAIDRANIGNSVGSTESEALSILESQQRTSSFGDRFEAGAPQLGVGALDFLTRGLTFGAFGAGDVIGEDTVRLQESVSDRNVSEMARRDMAAETISGISKTLQNNTNAMQSMNKNVQINSKVGGSN